MVPFRVLTWGDSLYGHTESERSTAHKSGKTEESGSGEREAEAGAGEELTAMKDRGGKGERLSVDDRYNQWKSLVPVLYDWLANHNLVWPSLSCRWGPQLEQATYKNRQRLYLSEQAS
ncbi:hypothetical protein RJ639_003120 [Escallonia herrerae]|uniref:Histone-binding protein RBBP4-like N-terminal domain-containing protein n=1 Tax=Escallonia herrerae TaxID=1293975 RepID=A0AA89AVQ9_9ASTE|nr:hypothetical protein RJ639_003120 [Escallonia herrerae]